MPHSRLMSLIGICLGVATVSMLWSALYVALPSIQHGLHASALQAQWVVNIYGVFITSTLVLFGRLADRLGYRLLFILGLILSLISILGSAFSQNITQLIICQAIFGLSGGIVLPVSQALISHIYPKNLRASAIGTWGMVVGLAMAAGPFVGGTVVGLGSWRVLFEAGSFFPLISLLILILFCPKPSQEENKLPLDLWGALALGLTICAFIIGIDNLSDSPEIKDAFIFGLCAVFFIALILIEKKAKAPMLCPRLWSNRQFLVASSASFTMLASIWGIFYMAPHLMQNNLHLSPSISGLLMLGVTLPLSLCAMIGGKLMNQLNPRLLMVFGFILFLISYGIQMHFNAQTSWTCILLALIFVGMGWGLAWTPSTVMAISTLGPKDAGLASGSLVTMQEMGGTLGLAITATLMRSLQGFGGFQMALWVLSAFSLLGLIISCFLKSEPKT